MGRPRSSSESGYYTQSVVSDSTEGVGHREPLTQITLTAPESLVAKPLRPDSEELVSKRLQEVLLDANERRASHIKLDKEFVEAILSVMNRRKDEHTEMKGKLDGIKRASQQYMDGLTVAHTEYDRECQARRDAEAEVSRLRVLLSGQAARLSAITSESKRQELQQQLSEELSHNLTGLEKDVSKLKVERDLTLAEVEALSASKRSPDLGTGSDVPVVNMSRTLSIRFDSLKTQYERELIPLTEQKEGLAREIAELKAFRDQFLEETTVLSARNEELAQLNRQYAHQIETSPGESPTAPTNEKKSASFDRPRPSISLPLTTSITNSSTFTDETADSRFVKIHKVDIPETPQSAYKPGKFIKWGMKASKEPTVQTIHAAESTKNKGRLEHVFQQLNILRFARCDHCGDKMWGSQFRCSGCHVAVHPRCVNHVQLSCSQRSSEDPGLGLSSLPPSMFGRELIEQVKSDWHDDEHMVPVIVEKCIEAVEARALDYEGIYRKTGGSGQSKTITQLFERGEYSTFDLLDQDRFNDICSVTSVLKTYLRQLPDPLLTYALHDEFVQASTIRDPEMKTSVLSELVRKLPTEHYYTLRMLMLHLNHVREQCDVNLMTARNLGVVFGPTLMRSQDSGAEFSDMGAKALSVEWLVENAPTIFNQQQAS
ncbi:hypothetical protein JAAARDRAFT_133451 [Jaapia argillacea MUCL 33604]|uniref:Rho-GAP domain-containing protein n=1 Tax=Jaapia argillacea MUCL 33604 TaxID=933084 RepID=A0A067PPX6_9AGAM|nr:hypothetical protein JAAARDRAFT_133451 [Jaapia argillacea MUCL 33604]